MKKAQIFVLATVILTSLFGCGVAEPSQSSSEPPISAPSATPAGSTQPSSEPTAATPSVATEQPTAEPDASDEDGVNSNSNILVAYFSMPETTDPNNMTQDEDNSVVVINGEVLGNTQYVANLIQENTGADIFRIQKISR